MQKLRDWEIIVHIVFIKEVIRKVFEEERFVEYDQMRNQERFEDIIEIRNQFEVVNRHKGNQLHILNQSPQRKESYISEEKHKELYQDNTNHDIVEIT